MDREFSVVAIEVIKGIKKNSKYMRVNSESVFSAKNPASAASKAFTKFCRLNKKKLDTCEVSLSVKEKNKDKIHSYSLQRIRDPQTVTINGKEVVYNYKITRKAI